MDMEKWGGILPEIKEVMERAIMMQEEMMIPITMNPWIKLLSETMRKADEAFDVMEMFPEELVQYLDMIGQQKRQMQQLEMQMQQQQMQMQNMQMQMQSMQMMGQEQQLASGEMALQDQAMAPPAEAPMPQ